MDAGYGKGPCNPIEGIAKKADQDVKNNKALMQDTHDF